MPEPCAASSGRQLIFTLGSFMTPVLASPDLQMTNAACLMFFIFHAVVPYGILYALAPSFWGQFSIYAAVGQVAFLIVVLVSTSRYLRTKPISFPKKTFCILMLYSICTLATNEIFFSSLILHFTKAVFSWHEPTAEEIEKGKLK